MAQHEDDKIRAEAVQQEPEVVRDPDSEELAEDDLEKVTAGASPTIVNPQITD
ncbi:hypothetical protein ACFL2Q_07605 [Thermodesulfobacteriota bacterium]